MIGSCNIGGHLASVIAVVLASYMLGVVLTMALGSALFSWREKYLNGTLVHVLLAVLPIITQTATLLIIAVLICDGPHMPLKILDANGNVIFQSMP